MNAATARHLLRRARSGALATLHPLSDAGSDGGPDVWPFASLVTVACDCDAAPIFLFSQLADHTRNLQSDNRAALLVEEASHRANPQTGPRISVLGRIQKSQEERHRRRFLARHPSARIYAGFADFAIYHMAIERVHYVGGFGKACWIEGDDIRADLASAAAIAAAEPEILRESNATGIATLCARRLVRRSEDGWVMIALDLEGCDLRRGHTVARLDFPHPASGPDDVREMLNRSGAGLEGERETKN